MSHRIHARTIALPQHITHLFIGRRPSSAGGGGAVVRRRQGPLGLGAALAEEVDVIVGVKAAVPLSQSGRRAYGHTQRVRTTTNNLMAANMAGL